jgi:ABC-type transport system substrate-binding protein
MLPRRTLLAATPFALLAPRGAAAQGGRAGTLKVALLGLDTADPHRHTGSIAVQQAYVEGLTSIADDGRVLPSLAQSWRIEEDGRRYVFRIRDGVAFHNGRIMTADDVRENAARVREKVRGGWLAAPMRLVSKLEAPDQNTFVMEMAEPYGPLLNLLSELWIMAPESPGWEATIRTPIGTGPFRFTRWVPNELFLGEAHDRYWQPGLPHAAAVEFNLRDLADESLPLRAGDLHIARVRASALPQVAADPAIQVQYMKDTSWWFWSFNNRRPRPPFDNVRVRQAVSFAMDKPGLMKLVAGPAGIVTNQMAAPGQFWFDEAMHKADPHAAPDLARARALLQTEGVDPARTPLRIVSWQTDFAQAAAQAMRALGFQVEHIALDDIGAQRRLNQYDWDLAPFSSGPRADIFLRFIRLMSDGPNVGLWGGPQDAAFDGLVKQAVAAVDLDQRRALYLQAWRHAMDRSWCVATGHAAEAIGNRREVTGYAPGFTWAAHRVDGGVAHARLGRPA